MQPRRLSQQVRARSASAHAPPPPRSQVQRRPFATCCSPLPGRSFASSPSISARHPEFPLRGATFPFQPAFTTHAAAKQIEQFAYDVPGGAGGAGWSVEQSLVYRVVMAGDGITKIFLMLEDNILGETVGILSKTRAHLDSPLFHHSAGGKGGFTRNHKGHEIVEQVLP